LLGAADILAELRGGLSLQALADRGAQSKIGENDRDAVLRRKHFSLALAA